MDNDIRKLIFQAIDKSISQDDFDRLQTAIEQDDAVLAEYLQAVNLSESLSEIAAEAKGEASSKPHGTATAAGSPSHWRKPIRQIAVSAAALLIVSGLGFWLGQRSDSGLSKIPEKQRDTQSANDESRIAGHATLRRSLDLQWRDAANVYREGDVLPDGVLALASGVAEIDFFCGATLIVEGPATLNVESDWSVRVLDGRVRANVPPAARGFIVRVADSEIYDLGTEFAIDVGADDARVEVIDGEVELRGGSYDGQHLTTGQRQSLVGPTGQPKAIEGLSTIGELFQRRTDAEAQRLDSWQAASTQLVRDERLIAWYPISTGLSERGVQNAASTGSSFDGTLVGPVEKTSGRFGAGSMGCGFARPGSRIRTRIDGEFQAFTFTTWVKIDSLAHRYNALFLADSYEDGEPHWQIRNDGRLMFSVMVDQAQQIRHFSEDEQRMVTHPGLHHVYYSEPIWDVAKSGQWLNLAAVYDPIARHVVQYVNGKQVSREQIVDKYHIASLRIGAAEIGNWGQPFRQTPWFSVRNLNGTIDELAVYNAALTGEEIHSLFEQGKPLGY